MKCLKTGLCFAIGNDVYHCDLFGDLVSKRIILKGFAEKTTELRGENYHLKLDESHDRLIPSPQFSNFMDKFNPDFIKWGEWNWMILDGYQRFSASIHSPKSQQDLFLEEGIAA